MIGVDGVATVAVQTGTTPTISTGDSIYLSHHHIAIAIAIYTKTRSPWTAMLDLIKKEERGQN